jgi:hypothetical protein
MERHSRLYDRPMLNVKSYNGAIFYIFFRMGLETMHHKTTDMLEEKLLILKLFYVCILIQVDLLLLYQPNAHII